MKNLSSDIEAAIKNAIEGMSIDINLVDVKDTKLAALMTSRLDSFASTKELITLWQNSPNAPLYEKLCKYIEKTIDAGNNSIEVLRNALRKAIDFDSIDAHDYGNAIKAKPIIFKAISELNSGVIELTNQLESGKIDLKAREFKRGFAEKYANQEFFPAKNYHKEWYDKETDSIMLCPLGTRGEVICLDGLNVMLPKAPAKKNILFSNLPVEQQYWRREEMPAGLSPENEEQYTEYILEQFRRRREGVWFMNNGVPVYLTGTHWFGLQFCKMLDDGMYKEFRYAQRDMYYFTRACILDPRCLGEVMGKSRRTGFTYEIIDFFVDDGTSTNNAKLGITSKTGDDAQEAFLKYTYALQNLPFFFIPVIKGKIDSKNEIEFAKPSDMSKATKKKRETNTNDYLNTLVNWRTTTDGAYDGQKMFRYLADEFGKWERPNNFETHWGRVSPTFDNGGRIVGKAFLGSTINPMAKGGLALKKVFMASNLKTRSIIGRTATGLYPYFLPAHKNMEEYTDKYGVCHEIVESGQSFINAQGIEKTIGSIQHLEAVRKAKRAQSDIAYNEELRANPMTIEEFFRDEITASLFDLEKLNEQIDFNNNNEIPKKLVRGNFQWENGKQDSKVIWVPSERGRFLVSWLPPTEMQNAWEMKRNSFGGVSKHPKFDYACCGIDTYDQDSVQDSVLEYTENGAEYNLGSKGAILAVTGTTMMDIPSNYFIFEYIARPQTAEIFFEDCLMACVFYSIPMLAESNKIRLLKHFKNRGYRGYSLNRFDKASNRLSPVEKELGGMPSNSQDVINMHWTAIETYINKYVGIYYNNDEGQPVREEGECGSMPFNRTLQDWAKFNVAKRTNYDASIASGLAILGINRRLYAPVNEKTTISIPLKRFKYAG